MSVKKYVNGAWQEIDTLKKNANGAWQEVEFARKYENGAWVDVYPSGMVGVVIFSQTPSNYAIVTDSQLNYGGSNAKITTRITLNKVVDSSDVKFTTIDWITLTDSYIKCYSENNVLLSTMTNSGKYAPYTIPLNTKYIEIYTSYNSGHGGNAVNIIVSGVRLVQ